NGSGPNGCGAPLARRRSLVAHECRTAITRGCRTSLILSRTVGTVGEPGPYVSASQALLVEPRGLVLADSGGKDLGFPRARRCLEAFELSEYRPYSVRALHTPLRRDTLPFKEETQEVAGLNRLNLGSQTLHGIAVNTCKETALAPFLFAQCW